MIFEVLKQYFLLSCALGGYFFLICTSWALYQFGYHTHTHTPHSFIQKSKKKSKVLPVHTNESDLRQASQQSNIGKGHMTLETVDH